MICEQKLKKFCCEDPSLIENYHKAVADFQMWDCHHRKETDEGLSRKELIEMGLYFNRPASELIFLTKAKHRSLHHKGKPSPLKGKQGSNKGKKIPAISIAKKGKKHSAETRAKMSASKKDKPKTKYKWLTPNGEIKIMSAQNVKCHHPDWVRIEKVD